jgi:hypothetical protein
MKKPSPSGGLKKRRSSSRILNFIPQVFPHIGKPKFNGFALEGTGLKRHIARLFYKGTE